MSQPDSRASTTGDGLAADTLGPVHVAVVALAASGPAASVALTLPVMAGAAGKALVFGFVLTTLVILGLTNTFVEFAKRIPSAGALLAWNSAGSGSQVGFVFGWFFVAGYLLITTTGITAFGGFAENFSRETLGLDIPWWVFSLVCAVYVIGLAWRGIGQSIKGALALLVVEIGVILLLVVGLVLAGEVQWSAAPFNPSESPNGWSGIGLAITFGVLSVIGYEEAATLAEEAKDARRAVAKGLWIAATFLCAFFVLVSFVMVTSYGSIADFAADPLAAETLADRIWGDLGPVISLVVILSCLALAQTSFNAGMRVIYSLGWVGLLPQKFAATHLRFKTPTTAIIAFSAVVLPAAFISAAVLGPLDVYAYCGFLTAVFFLIMYLITNLSLVRYVARDDRDRLNMMRHVVLPVITALGVAYPLFKQVSPLPDDPFRSLLVVVVAWAVLGILILLAVRRSRRVDVDSVARAFAALDE